jgi:hypothetical protein
LGFTKMTHRNVLNYLRGDLTRKTMLFVLFPLILISYFGILGLAVWLYPESYDWRYISISKLLYPRNNPEFHYIASASVAVTGVLMIPFAGYIQRRLRRAAPAVVMFGAILFFGGCICLTLAGLIASHPARGVSRLPKLHEILARISVIGIGVGTLMFTVCATRGYLRPEPGRRPYRRGLVISWNLLTMPALLITVSWLMIRIFLKKSARAHHVIVTSAAWNLGFWEWIGSVAVVAFLFCAALFLPEHDLD